MTKYIVLFLIFLLSACAEKEPLRIGFIAGVSGRVADLGVAGRNGALLAVELRNQKGGVDGRKIELLVRDDEQNPTLAQTRFIELVDAKVDAVIGPMTSAIAKVIIPLANEHKLVLMSPTATSNEFSNRDDYFFRVISPAGEYAIKAALFQHKMGMRKVAILLDASNQSYSENWAHVFQTSFAALGGQVVFFRSFVSGDDAGLDGLAQQALDSGADGVALIANSVDAALLTQQIRRRNRNIKIVMAEWAATERYIDLAGRSAEGVVMAQFFDRASQSADYLAFHQKFLARFGSEPGFAGMTAFDAANVVFDALTGKSSGQSLKQTILTMKKFKGTQAEIDFGLYGDAARDILVTTVRNGKYEILLRQPQGAR